MGIINGRVPGTKCLLPVWWPTFVRCWLLLGILAALANCGNGTMPADSVQNNAKNTDATSTYTYDALGQLTKVAYSTGMVIEYSYDANGNRIGQTVRGASGGTRGDFDHDGTVEFLEVVRVVDAYYGRVTLTEAERNNLNTQGAPAFAVVIEVIDRYLGR